MGLWGCSAVVTGAASGLGAGTALDLAEAGSNVTVIDIVGGGVEKVADGIGGLAIPGDVADSRSLENALAAAARRMARPACWCTASAAAIRRRSSAPTGRCCSRISANSSKST